RLRRRAGNQGRHHGGGERRGGALPLLRVRLGLRVLPLLRILLLPAAALLPPATPAQGLGRPLRHARRAGSRRVGQPRGEAERLAPEGAFLRGGSPQGVKTVLVVDDEPQILA